jgi:hypothetical protein
MLTVAVDHDAALAVHVFSGIVSGEDYARSILSMMQMGARDAILLSVCVLVDMSEAADKRPRRARCVAPFTTSPMVLAFVSPAGGPRRVLRAWLGVLPPRCSLLSTTTFDEAIAWIGLQLPDDALPVRMARLLSEARSGAILGCREAKNDRTPDLGSSASSEREPLDSRAEDDPDAEDDNSGPFANW